MSEPHDNWAHCFDIATAMSTQIYADDVSTCLTASRGVSDPSRQYAMGLNKPPALIYTPAEEDVITQPPYFQESSDIAGYSR